MDRNRLGRQENGKNNRIVGVVSGALALAAVGCLPQMLNLKGNVLAASNSWFGVFVYGVFWFLCYRSIRRIQQQEGRIESGRRKERHRGMAAAGIIAGAFSLCIAFGVQLDHMESVNFRSGKLWWSVLVWTVMLTLWIYQSWRWLEQREIRDCGNEIRNGCSGIRGEDRQAGYISHMIRTEGGGCEEDAAQIEDGGCEENVAQTENGECKEAVVQKEGGCCNEKAFLDSWIQKWDGMSEKRKAAVMICYFLLCWFPVFLAVYPGFFVYDAQEELVQVQTRQFTTHHPLPHVLLLGGIIQAVHKLSGSYNAGIAVYTIVQMIGMAGVFAYVLAFMKRSGIRRWLRIVSAFYFAFFPVNVMFVLCSAKDGIFSGALLILLTALADMAKQPEAFFADRKKRWIFGVSALVMMSFRHNGMYAFLVLIPVMLFFYGKGFRRKMGLLLGIVFGAYVLVSSGLTKALSAQDFENQEMLTVPIQQLARVWKYEADSLTEEEKQTLYEIIPEEALPYYTAKVSDGVKRWFRNEAFAANPKKYIRLWAEVGVKHSFTYLNAWFMTSYGFWYPDTVIDVYRGNGVFTFTYEDSSFFGYEVELPGVRDSKIPWLAEWYRKMSLEIAQQKLSAVSMLFSPGFLFWVFIFAGGYAYYRKKYELLLPFGMIFLLWLTVILGPTYLPRYVLILWFALPGVAAVLVNEG